MRTKSGRIPSLVLTILAVIILATGCAQQSAGPAKSTLTLSPPLLRASQFLQMQEPTEQLASYLSQVSGVKVQAYVPTDYGNTILGLRDGTIDIAYFPAGLFSKVEAELGVTAAFLVTVDGSATEDGAIWVRADSGLSSVSQLRGKTIVAADAYSAAGWLLPAAELKAAGVDPLSDTNTQFKAVEADSLVAVLEGDADAAFALRSALDDDAVAEAGGAAQLKTLKEYKDVPIGVIVYSNSVTKAQARDLDKAFAGIAKSGFTGTDSDGNSVPLLQVMGWDGVKAAKASDFKTIAEKSKALGMIASK